MQESREIGRNRAPAEARLLGASGRTQGRFSRSRLTLLSRRLLATAHRAAIQGSSEHRPCLPAYACTSPTAPSCCSSRGHHVNGGSSSVDQALADRFL